MIGFEDVYLLDEVQGDEDEKTRFLSKSQLYHMVASKYFIPPLNSRGMTRDYLLRVWRKQVYTVEQQAMKAFEFQLQPEQTVKIGIPNSSYLVRKLNQLLQERGSQPLGFNEIEVPDQKWLHRITREIDRMNLTEFYKMPVERIPALTNTKLNSHFVFQGRTHASQYFLSVPGIKGNKRFKDQLKEISDTYRSLCSTKINKEVAEEEVRQLTIKTNTLSTNLNDMISRMSVAYTTMKHSSVHPEALLSPNSNVSKEVRDTLSDSTQFLKYIYCTDNILDRNNQETQALTTKSLENVQKSNSSPNSATQSGKTTPKKPL